MAIFGHNQWYTGELNPNQFASDANGRLSQTQQQQGLSDAFNGAEMGLEQVQQSNGPLYNQSQQPLLGRLLPSLSTSGKMLAAIGVIMVGGLVLRKVRK